MRSKASVAGHPLHPILIAFPIGFLFGSIIFDGLGAYYASQALYVTASHLAIAGVVSGLIAAIPGIIDFLTIVPPDSSAKKRATYHMIVNVSAMVLYAASWYARDGASLTPTTPSVILALLSIGLMTAGGWMGGTLVYRNQIGVDHRYAEAGKWKEESIDESSERWLKVASEDELEEDQMKLLHVGQRRIVLARTKDGYTAFQDHCTHRGGSLADGALVCGTIQCPWHGSQFNSTTGEVVSGPAKEPISVYPIRIENGGIYMLVPERDESAGWEHEIEHRHPH